MKMRTWLIITLLLFPYILTGCNVIQNEKLPIEMVAFNSLTREEQKKIPVSPKDSVVDKVTVDEELAKQVGNEFAGETIHRVTFKGTEDEMNGRLVVYLHKDRDTVIGKGYEKKE